MLDDTFREDRSPAKKSKNNLALIRKFAYNILRLVSIQCGIKRPNTEIMDRLADDFELLGAYIFKGIKTLSWKLQKNSLLQQGGVLRSFDTLLPTHAN